MTKRNNSLDLLRVISTIAVIMIHINWNYFGPISESYQWSFHYAIESLINIVTRFSVPAFVRFARQKAIFHFFENRLFILHRHFLHAGFVDL